MRSPARRALLGAVAAAGASVSPVAAWARRARKLRRRPHEEQERKEDEDPTWRELWNGEDLGGWETWLGIPPSEVAGLDLPRGAGGRYREPLGLGRDPRGVFSVTTQAGRRVLRVSGELTGALNQLLATSRIHGAAITRAIAEEALADMILQEARPIAFQQIEKAVCEMFGLGAESLQASSRAKALVAPR